MKKNILIGMVILLLVISVIVLFFISKSIDDIEDLSYDKNKKGDHLLYLLENNVYVPFLVLSSNYNGNTLLLRKDVLDHQKSVNEYSSYYENSDIDHYLNSDYLKSLKEIDSLIVHSEIDIVSEEALGKTENMMHQIERKIFLLSYHEVVGEIDVNGVKEGKKIDYFTDAKRRQAFCNNEISSWWLRTPNTYYTSCNYVVGINNKIGCSNAYDLNGIRPAFCIKNNVKIKKKFLKSCGEIYVIDTKE